MKIAIPEENGYVNQHFGHSQSFAVVEVADGRAGAPTLIDSSSLQHQHEGLAGLLRREGVQTVVVGGIGRPAAAALIEAGLEVVSGAQGPIAEVAQTFAEGKLRDQGGVHDHGHHDHDHHDHNGHNHLHGHGPHHHE